MHFLCRGRRLNTSLEGKMKKLLALLLTVVLVGSLTACLPTGELFETEKK